ncbi:MAG: LysR family transcriptional regulator, partial [Alphaproteobacteria bacterium]|nr:LysR family transcriptional regulator [Alphaproteobacteria bacterium]
DPERFEYVEIGSDQLIPVSVPDEQGKPKFNLPGNGKSPIPHLVYASDAFLGKLVAHLLEKSSVPCFLKTYYENSLAEALKTAAIEGLGLAWLPESTILTALETNQLVRGGDPKWNIDLKIRVYRSRSSNKPKAAEVWKTFLDGKPAT